MHHRTVLAVCCQDQLHVQHRWHVTSVAIRVLYSTIRIRISSDRSIRNSPLMVSHTRRQSLTMDWVCVIDCFRITFTYSRMWQSTIYHSISNNIEHVCKCDSDIGSVYRRVYVSIRNVCVHGSVKWHDRLFSWQFIGANFARTRCDAIAKFESGRKLKVVIYLNYLK
jgi:hypothetical protein